MLSRSNHGNRMSIEVLHWHLNESGLPNSSIAICVLSETDRSFVVWMKSGEVKTVFVETVTDIILEKSS